MLSFGPFLKLRGYRLSWWAANILKIERIILFSLEKQLKGKEKKNESISAALQDLVLLKSLFLDFFLPIIC
jgi:hypothetical protein